jgi:hypothetical protein
MVLFVLFVFGGLLALLVLFLLGFLAALVVLLSWLGV